jgi:hypothetical protein
MNTENKNLWVHVCMLERARARVCMQERERGGGDPVAVS